MFSCSPTSSEKTAQNTAHDFGGRLTSAAYHTLDLAAPRHLQQRYQLLRILLWTEPWAIILVGARPSQDPNVTFHFLCKRFNLAFQKDAMDFECMLAPSRKQQNHFWITRHWEGFKIMHFILLVWLANNEVNIDHTECRITQEITI